MSEHMLESKLLKDESARARLVQDCVRVIEAEVESKRGITGLAIKAAFKIVKKVKPGFVGQVMNALLPEFVASLLPVYDDFKAGSDNAFSDYIRGRETILADSLLGITDKHAARAQNRVVKKAYEKLRIGALKHVSDAMPRVAKMLEGYF